MRCPDSSHPLPDGLRQAPRFQVLWCLPHRAGHHRAGSGGCDGNLLIWNASRTERIRVGRASCLLQDASPPGMFSFACQKRTRKAPATFEAREARTRGCSPLVTPKLLGSIQKIQAAPLKDFLCSADFESLARRAVRISLCIFCYANASAGSRRCKMPLPATILSREKRKPEIRRFPAFFR